MKLNLISEFDYALSTACLGHKFNRQVAAGCKWISRSGDGHGYFLLGVLLLCFEHQQGGVFFATCLLSFAIELPVYIALKQLFKRNRPTNLPCFIEPSDRYSLPSGHAAAAFLMASQISVFYPAFTLVAFIWASLIAISRVLLGVHFISDIVAGALLGLCAAYFTFSLVGV